MTFVSQMQILFKFELGGNDAQEGFTYRAWPSFPIVYLITRHDGILCKISLYFDEYNMFKPTWVGGVPY